MINVSLALGVISPVFWCQLRMVSVSPQGERAPTKTLLNPLMACKLTWYSMTLWRNWPEFVPRQKYQKGHISLWRKKSLGSLQSADFHFIHSIFISFHSFSFPLYLMEWRSCGVFAWNENLKSFGSPWHMFDHSCSSSEFPSAFTVTFRLLSFILSPISLFSITFRWA